MKKQTKYILGALALFGGYFLYKKKKDENIINGIDVNSGADKLPVIVNNDDDVINKNKVVSIGEDGWGLTAEGAKISASSSPKNSYPNGIGTKLNNIPFEVQGFTYLWFPPATDKGTYFYQDSRDNHYYSYDKLPFDDYKKKMERTATVLTDKYTPEFMQEALIRKVESSRLKKSTDEYYVNFEMANNKGKLG
jgi:hypothetical protein